MEKNIIKEWVENTYDSLNSILDIEDELLLIEDSSIKNDACEVYNLLYDALKMIETIKKQV